MGSFIEYPRTSYNWRVTMPDGGDIRRMWSHVANFDMVRYILSKEYVCYNQAYEGARFIARLSSDWETPPAPPAITMKAVITKSPSRDPDRPPLREAIAALSWPEDGKHDLEWTLRLMAAEIPDFEEYRFFLNAQMSNPGHTNFTKILKNDFGVDADQWLWYSEILAIKDEAGLIQFKMQFDSLGEAPLFVLDEPK